MIPLIHHTPRLTLLAASRALLTAELHKPRYFPVLLGAVLPTDWPSGQDEQAAMHYLLEQLTAGGRTAAGWYNWYAIQKATATTPATLVGTGGFLGPPDATGTVEINYMVVIDWRGQGLATELVGGLLQQAARTTMVHHVLAHTSPDNLAAQQVLQHNGFRAAAAPDADGRLRFERTVEPEVLPTAL